MPPAVQVLLGYAFEVLALLLLPNTQTLSMQLRRVQTFPNIVVEVGEATDGVDRGGREKRESKRWVGVPEVKRKSASPN